MPVGAAIGGAAIIGGVATSKAASKTSKAATQTAEQNNATQTAIYNQNKAAQQPFLQGGNTAWQAWQSQMGLAPQASTQPQPQSAGGISTGQYGGAVAVGNNGNALMRPGLATRLEGDGAGGLTSGMTGQTQTLPANALSPGGAGGPATPNALTGYDAFKASMGYQEGLDEGMRGLNTRLASNGQLFSGDAGRAAIKYNQQYADSFRGNYLDRLMQGTQVGTGAANALAGVGSSYANATSANNNAALNARANANAAAGQAWSDGAANVATGAAYLYGNRSAPGGNALGSSYSGSGRPIFW